MRDAIDPEEMATVVEDEYLRNSIHISPEDMNAEFEQIPGILAYWNAQYANALRSHLEAVVNVKVTKARVYLATRDALIKKGSKYTEELLKHLVEANQDFIDEQYTAAAAEARKNEMFGKLDAIRSKKEMLISLGAQLRAEMGGDPLIRERAGARRHMQSDDEAAE